MMGDEGPTHCEKRLGYGITPTTFQIIAKHPSGAMGEFNFEPIKHELSNVPFMCGAAISGLFEKSTLYYPRLFWSFGLKSKKITGTGLLPAEWTYNYIPAKGGFAPTGATGFYDCASYVCDSNKKLEVTGPDNTVTRYQFGIEYRKTEGQLQRIDTIRGGISNKTEQNEYIVDADIATQTFDGEAGLSPQPRANVFLSNFQRPLKRKLILQDGVNFESRIDSFDSHVTPTKETKFSSLGDTTQSTTAYEHNLSKWVIGQVASVTNLDTTPSVEVSRNLYDATTALPIQTYSFGQLKATYTYLPDGNLNTAKDALNRITTLDNYYRGVPRNITFPDATTIAATVNATGTIASTTDQLGSVTSYEYDVMGRLTKKNLPTGDANPWVSMNYWFRKKSDGKWAHSTWNDRYAKEVIVDDLWRPTLQTEWDWASSAATVRQTVWRYDAVGRVVFQSYPFKDVTDFSTLLGIHTEYDALGRVTKTRQDSELGQLNTTTEYLTGFQTRVTNPRGFATTTSYQVFDTPDTNRPEIIVAPEGQTTTILRNVFGNPLGVTRSGIWNGSALNSTRSYVYDSQQRLCKRIEPETGATIIDYDAVGNLAWSVQGSALTSNTCDRASVAAADKTARTYNTMNRLVTTDVPGTADDLSYIYFADGALQTLFNGSNRWDYTYNKLRLPVTEQLTIDGRVKTLTHADDNYANESSLTYPSGLVVATTPNALGQASQAGTFATGVNYHPMGGMSVFNYGNGIEHSMTPNTRMLPTLSKDMNGTIAILHDTYAFDASNVASITDGTAGAGGNRTMSYDNADRLTQTIAPNLAWMSNTFSYDALDNIRTNTLGGRSHNYQYNATTKRLDQLTLPNATVARNLAYDAQGNVTTNGAQSYVFDKANRMQGVNGIESYQYDGHGRRVKTTRTSDGKISYPIYSLEGKLVTDDDQRSNKTIDYVYLNGSLVAKRSAPMGSTTYTATYLHTDSLGSPVAESDAAKTVTFIKRYTPYGEPSDQNYVQGPGFTGHVTDAATGLTYAQQRYYDPVIGRFLSPDPDPSDMNNGWNFNRYNYAANNPYKFTDPDGRIIETPWDVANVALGVVSIGANITAGNYVSAAVDLGGLIYDGAATVVPGLPAGAGVALKVYRAGDKAVDVAKGAANGVRAGKKHTPAANRLGREQNRAANGGDLKCPTCSKKMNEPKQNKLGEPVDRDSAVGDHEHPKSKGGDGATVKDMRNHKTKCWECNSAKSDKIK